MTPKTDSQGRKPRLAYLLASGFGLGYLPIAPGTWGSLGGVALYCAAFAWLQSIPSIAIFFPGPVSAAVREFLERLLAPLAHSMRFIPWALPAAAVACAGVWAAGRVEAHAGAKDPQFIVIDEICGQLIAFAGVAAPNWKYLLLGFILFRVFDIWKPFPAPQAESLPGGWGIMADDWVAGAYAAILLWAASLIVG